ncbi:MAG: HAMP domain-containing sensor histidine kinase [Pseudomonadota bacterium]
MTLTIEKLSLRHYILLGFLVSLIPLAIVVWQSTLIQKSVSDSWIDFSEEQIKFVRLAVEMNKVLTDTERSVKQFKVLQSESIATLANNGIDQYLAFIEQICSSASKHSEYLCDNQLMDIQRLKRQFKTVDDDTLNAHFSLVKNRQAMLMDGLWKNINKEKDKQIIVGESQQKALGQWILLLATISFILILLVSRNVTKPIKILEEKINRIGEGKPGTALRNVSFYGPVELLRINRRLEWLEDRLDKLESLRHSFLRHASHELKTPLASIFESCAILKDQLLGSLSQEQNEVVQILDDSAHCMGHLVEQLLDYNYILQVEQTALKPLNPEEVLNRLEQRYLPFLQKRQQSLAIACNGRSIRTDHTLFSRIIENLLSNAHAYGDELGKILIDLRIANDQWQLTVSNTGPKLSDQQRERIFEPFYRTELPRTGLINGSGLGLSIVKDCVQLLNGQIKFVESIKYDFSIRITAPMY